MRSIIKKHFLILGTASFAVVVSTILAISFMSRPSEAISGWNAGNIISDAVFTNKTTMSTSSIQSFLNSKVPTCDTWGTQPSEFGGGTRRQWAEARGYSAPFTCLKNYSQGGKSAARIIYEAAQTYSINPQVLIVLLQKEQGLVTDTWPLSIQYRSAMGYGCPDNAACDSDYYGFTNQVQWAARMFRAILNDSPTWYTPYELGNNFIQYNPVASCGGSNVNIQNRATQALYNYTPYQPNQAALNAGWGTASCGSYGNRNFYLYFTSWFGSTSARYTSLSPPRWLQMANTAQKTNLWTREDTSSTLVENRQIKFADKLYLDGNWYLRTESDKRNGAHYGVLASDVEEIPYTNMTTPQWMRFKVNIHKRDPRTGRGVDNTMAANRRLFFDSQTVVNGTTFYRTQADTNNSYNKGVPSSALEAVPFQSFADPRWLQVDSTTTKVNPRTGATVGTSIAAGTQFKFTSKIYAGGWYYRTEADTSSNTIAAIPASDLKGVSYVPMAGGARCLELTNNTHKFRPQTGEAVQAFSAGRQICFSQQITVDGVVYYRTRADVGFRNDLAIPASDTGPI